MRQKKRIESTNRGGMNASQWLKWDINSETRLQVEKMTEEDNTELFERPRIAFGTAGLRAEMGPGPSRMNDLVVLQAAQGLLAYLNSTSSSKSSIVLGYDHRKRGSLSSKRFAEITAKVFVENGWKVFLFKRTVPTPFVPFAIKHFSSAAGVMVTASHNPKNDNGYKVYWGNACQIIPPHDIGIAQAIMENLEPQITFADNEQVDTEEDPTDLISDLYFKNISSILKRRPASKRPLKIVYTAMHGIGHEWAKKSFESFELSPFIPVPEQVEPDPEFPTVAFPNPEEGKGALQLSFNTAKTHGATLVLANDPDADRLAVAELVSNDEWKVFTGNEIAALLGCWEVENYCEDKSKTAFVASTVSSKFLQRVAEVEGMKFLDCLTGFKWIGNESLKLREQGYDVIFAFEEAIGFCIGDNVPDKDGISAVSVFAEMANALHGQGLTCSQRLVQLQEQYGYFCSNNHYIVSHDTAKNHQVFDSLRADGYIKEAAGYKIVNVRDLKAPGYDSQTKDNKPTLPIGENMITFYFENSCVVTLRMSGTEPKLKYYTELRGDSKIETQKALDELVDKAVLGCMLKSLR